MMYGQMTAGSWIYIGTQGILQGTYETFAECARQHCGGSLAGTLTVTGGCGGMGGAQPLAVTMNDGTCLIADVCIERLEKRVTDRYLDKIMRGLDEAIDLAVNSKENKETVSIGYVGNIVDLLARLKERNIIPEVLTDQTSAHDPLVGYYPTGMSRDDADALRDRDTDSYIKQSIATMSEHVKLMLWFMKQGAKTFDYGNNIRQRAFDNGVENAFDFKGFVPEYIRPQFCRGRGPFRWCALSGDPEDIKKTDEVILKLFPEDESLKRWITMAQERVAFQGLPCRICWLGLGERDKAGLAFNELVKNDEVSAPIVIGRDHLDCGSVASPNRETEGMLDGSDAISDWPLINFALNIASGASWVSFHHGGGVGIGYSQHAGQVIVADGTPESAARLKRVLTNDPMMGIFRHVDAGYEEAAQCANEQHVKIPMQENDA